MEPGTHVAPHTGLTNARLRIHLGLSGLDGVWIRVGDEVRAWRDGRCIVFDDSFVHEVWHSQSVSHYRTPSRKHMAHTGNFNLTRQGAAGILRTKVTSPSPTLTLTQSRCGTTAPRRASCSSLTCGTSRWTSRRGARAYSHRRSAPSSWRPTRRTVLSSETTGFRACSREPQFESAIGSLESPGYFESVYIIHPLLLVSYI